jgi:hypothetical protein
VPSVAVWKIGIRFQTLSHYPHVSQLQIASQSTSGWAVSTPACSLAVQATPPFQGGIKRNMNTSVPLHGVNMFVFAVPWCWNEGAAGWETITLSRHSSASYSPWLAAMNSGLLSTVYLHRRMGDSTLRKVAQTKTYATAV